MPRTTSCLGCGKNFTSPKYRRSHLSQSNDPRCESERRAFLAHNLSGYSPPTSPQQLASSPIQSPIQPSLDPQLELPDTPDLGGLSNFEDDGNISHCDDEEDMDLILDSDSDSDSDLDLDLDSGDTNNEHGRLLSTEEVTNLQGKIWGEIYTEVYPGQQAGVIHSVGIPTMKEFDNTIGGPPSNPYSPFTSRTDWELAKWAKLQGPSSTAFTELMGVTGVCYYLLHWYPTDNRNSYVNSWGPHIKMQMS